MDARTHTQTHTHNLTCMDKVRKSNHTHTLFFRIVSGIRHTPTLEVLTLGCIKKIKEPNTLIHTHTNTHTRIHKRTFHTKNAKSSSSCAFCSSPEAMGACVTLLYCIYVCVCALYIQYVCLCVLYECVYVCIRVLNVCV